MTKKELVSIAKSIDFTGALADGGFMTSYQKMAEIFAEKFNLKRPVKIECVIKSISMDTILLNMTDEPKNVLNYVYWEMQFLFSFLNHLAHDLFDYYNRDKKRIERLINICKEEEKKLRL